MPSRQGARTALGGPAGCLGAFLAGMLVLGLTTCRKAVWGYYPPDFTDIVLAVLAALSVGLIVRLAVNWIAGRGRRD